MLVGFDFGVGMLHRHLGRDDDERRLVADTIGPWWNGNEVWLVVATAAVFAAFPSWYATWLSAGYLVMVAALVGLIVRGVSIEYRERGKSEQARRRWSWLLIASSALAPLALGLMLGDLLAGVPIGSDQEFAGNPGDLLTAYGLLLGLLLVLLCVVQGAAFVGVRTTEDLRDRAHRTVARLSMPAAVAIAVFGVATYAIDDDSGARSILPAALAAVSALVGGFGARAGRDMATLILTSVSVALTVSAVFFALYPNVMVSSSDSATTLTVSGTASSHYSLQIMTIAVVIFLPVVLLYSAWSFHAFRRRLVPLDRGVSGSSPMSNTP